MSFVCTSFSEQEDWTFGEQQLTHNFSSVAGSMITIGFTGAAWIAPISGSWNISTSFSLAVRNDTGRINSTPRAITAPVIRLLEGCSHTISLIQMVMLFAVGGPRVLNVLVSATIFQVQYCIPALVQ